jgi:hypothetical protein
VEGMNNAECYRKALATKTSYKGNWCASKAMKPWLSTSVDDYSVHMKHSLVGQGVLLREHLVECVLQLRQERLMFLIAGNGHRNSERPVGFCVERTKP